jgi:hypothetical protein
MTRHQVAVSNKDKRKLNRGYKEMHWVLIPLRHQVAISCPSSAFSGHLRSPSWFLLVLFHLFPNLLPVPLQPCCCSAARKEIETKMQAAPIAARSEAKASSSAIKVNRNQSHVIPPPFETNHKHLKKP